MSAAAEQRKAEQMLAERVTRGAQLLDEIRPGWYEEINLDKLNMESTCNCIVGQLVGTFCNWTVLGSYYEEIKDPSEYGWDWSDRVESLLNLRASRGWSSRGWQWDALERLWLEEIHIRLNGDW